ncbi:MAG: fibronectin type III domain-containing protein [Bacteroidia bacterium]|nr:fibronectin type III domain-containing protein [Bacteroidia bacterium]
MNRIIRYSGIALLMRLLCFTTIGYSQSTTLISKTAPFKYLDNGSNQGTAWRGVSFNDASWSQGNAVLGYGDSYSTKLASGRFTYYFRKSVSFSPASFNDYRINLRRDDGIVVYVNGTEVYRNNMPSGTIGYRTGASSACSDDGTTILSFVLSGALFVNGNNVIAAEVHNNTTSSSDLTFELELIGNGSGPVACGTPDVNLFSSINVTASSAQVGWAAVSGAISYEVAYRVLNGGQAFSNPIPATSTSLNLTGLLSATIYEFIVRVQCASSTGTYSAAGIFTTLTAPPLLTAWPAESWTEADNLTSAMDPNGLTELSGLFWNGIKNTLLVSHGDGRLRVLQLNSSSNTFAQIANLSIPGGPEGITQVNLNADEFYTIDENIYEIRKYSHNTGFTSATLMNSWNILAAPSIMTNTGNTGPEGIAFVPDSFLTAAGFISESTGLPYTSVKGMGGLIFIAHQNLGQVWVFDVNPNVNNDFAYVGKYSTGKSESCDLAFDRSTGLMYILHNVGANTLEVTNLTSALNGSSPRKFTTIREYEVANPAGNVNIEGFAITNKYSDSTNVRVWLCRDVESVESSSYKADCLRHFNPFDYTADSPIQSSVIIPANASFKYLDNGSNQGTEWRGTSFNDASWPEGNSVLGFEDPHSTQLVSGRITYYFRKSVSISNPSQFQNFTMKIRRDDGIVVYVNGTEVYRNNMPTGTISYNTTASSTCSDDGVTIFTHTLASTYFVNGINVIAAEVHNRSTSSSDLTFALELIGNSPTPVMARIANVSAEQAEVVDVSQRGFQNDQFADHLFYTKGKLHSSQIDNNLRIFFNEEMAGSYVVKLLSLNGQLVLEGRIEVSKESSFIDIPVPEYLNQNSGIFILSVMNYKIFYTDKIFLN